MTVRDSLSTFDDAALEALAPKGVVRRARRDLEAGLARIAGQDGAALVVKADGETVRIDAAGPARAACTCPATGVCRHILLAVMAVNAKKAPGKQLDFPSGEAPSEPAPSMPPVQTAATRLLELSEAQIRSFAGGDLAGAIQLAGESTRADIEEVGANLRVSLEGGAASVVFMAAAKGPALLKDAGFKGPKSTTRKVVTAAALIARGKLGARALAAPEPDVGEVPADGGPVAALDRQWLEDTAQAIGEATRMTLAGSAELGADLLFESSIAARLAAAPRLMGLLRSLSRQAAAAATRAISFQPERFLLDAATAHGLCLALKSMPDDPDLTGVLRRAYTTVPAMEAVFLGAHAWTGASSSRGITFHFWEPATGQWLSTTNARGAGQDPAFSAHRAWNMPLWGAATAAEMAGCTVHLPTPQSDGQGVLSHTSLQSCKPGSRIATLKDLAATSCIAPDFAAARAAMAQVAGAGLKDRLAPPVALVQPARFGEAWFDPITQLHRWQMFDAAGDSLSVMFPASEADIASRVHREGGRIAGLLVQGQVVDGALLVHPRIAVVQAPMSASVSFVSLTLDDWPRGGVQTAPSAPPPPPAGGFLSRLLGRKERAAAAPQASGTGTTHAALATSAIEALVAQLQSGRYPAQAQDIARRCEAAGLGTLARLLEQAGKPDASTRHQLAAAWVAGQILRQCAWQYAGSSGGM